MGNNYLKKKIICLAIPRIGGGRFHIKSRDFAKNISLTFPSDIL